MLFHGDLIWNVDHQFVQKHRTRHSFQTEALPLLSCFGIEGFAKPRQSDLTRTKPLQVSQELRHDAQPLLSRLLAFGLPRVGESETRRQAWTGWARVVRLRPEFFAT